MQTDRHRTTTTEQCCYIDIVGAQGIEGGEDLRELRVTADRGRENLLGKRLAPVWKSDVKFTLIDYYPTVWWRKCNCQGIASQYSGAQITSRSSLILKVASERHEQRFSKHLKSGWNA